jgi:hypothetical protein
VPNALPSCSSPNTLLCVNGLSSWCNANSKLEVGTKTCSVNTCHPTSSGVGCADSNSYRSVGSTCNNGGKCQTTGSLNGFATCGCVTPQAPTSTRTNTHHSLVRKIPGHPVGSKLLKLPGTFFPRGHAGASGPFLNLRGFSPTTAITHSRHHSPFIAAAHLCVYAPVNCSDKRTPSHTIVTSSCRQTRNRTQVDFETCTQLLDSRDQNGGLSSGRKWRIVPPDSTLPSTTTPSLPSHFITAC